MRRGILLTMKKERRMSSGKLLGTILDRLPYVGRLRQLLVEQRRSEGRYPAGHYYSPIPSDADIHCHLDRRENDRGGLPDIDICADAQHQLLEHYATYYLKLPCWETARDGLRYHFGQEWFRYSDAVFLYCHLRHTQPRAIVEVGSGWSTAVMLDTMGKFMPQRPRLTCVEPFPERLQSLLQPGDEQRLEIIAKPVQEVDGQTFSHLAAGDLLFIDSSHVLKAGSDVYHLLFRVLPNLPTGVFVHFHDIFWNFDYPTDWLSMGRFWNEAYFLRAFLASNSQWRIHCFNSWAGQACSDLLREKMPICLKDTGGSLYIVRK